MKCRSKGLYKLFYFCYFILFCTTPPGSVPSSELVPTPLLLQASVSPPRLGTKGGGNTRLRVRVLEEPIRTTGEKAWHSVGPFLTLKCICNYLFHFSTQCQKYLVWKMRWTYGWESHTEEKIKIQESTRHMSLLSVIHQHYAWPHPNSWESSFFCYC